MGPTENPLSSSWPPALPAPAPAGGLSILDEHVDSLDARPARPINARVALQALRRYGWQILCLWALGSVGLTGLIYYKVKPGYEATAWLEVKPLNKYALAAPSGPAPDMESFMQTQVQLLTSPDVLGKALLDPRVVGLGLVRDTLDPKAKLRELLHVTIPPKTSLILVGITTPHRDEGPIVINAVVDAYLAEASTWTDEETRRQLEQLQTLKDRYRNDVDRYRKELEILVEKTGNADPNSPLQFEAERYRQYRAQLNKVEIERIEADVALGVLREARRQDQTTAPQADPVDTEALLRRAFQSDPDVIALLADKHEAQEALADTLRMARKGHNDAASRIHRQHIEQVDAQLNQLWAEKGPLLRAAITADPKLGDPIAIELRAAELKLAKLREEEDRLRATVDAMHATSRNEGNDILKAQFTRSEFDSATEMYRRASQMLESLSQEAHGSARISRISEARPSQLPARDNRMALMAMAPLGLIVALVGLFVLVEARAARVADPDDLAMRLHVGVIGVVPPLPPTRPGRGPKALRDQRRRVEEYVQSLDHLRVTLCASARADQHRCVMITSASGGEGKTTLAAQLASRCVNAGLSTLLVDADLRRPSLSALLEIPAGPGLSEVLLGTITPEEAFVPVTSAGGFHLLSAGTGRHDPSRLLQGDRLGQLVARLRDAFDVVLIDVPPILPVPDALLIGRWTDGAIVAVRHDASRFPLVDRAQRKLIGLGIPVLGAVLNGCRPSEASYGAYGYYGDDFHEIEDQTA